MTARNERNNRFSVGISIGDTVPLWRSKGYKYGRRRFYAWANRPNEHSTGGFGIKAGLVFIRLTWRDR